MNNTDLLLLLGEGEVLHSKLISFLISLFNENQDLKEEQQSLTEENEHLKKTLKDRDFYIKLHSATQEQFTEQEQLDPEQFVDFIEKLDRNLYGGDTEKPPALQEFNNDPLQ